MAKTGLLRMPESLRIRIYEDGEVIITTRGRIDPAVHTYSDVVARLAELEVQSRALMPPRRCGT